MNSSFLNLNVKDLLKTALTIALTTLAGSILNIISTMPPTLPTWPEFVVILKAAGLAGLGYLIKQYLTNSNSEPLTKEK